MSRRGGHSLRSRGPGLALAGLLPATLHLVLTLGFDSSYSHQLYARQAFLYQYRHGVYRYRVLGRELVAAVGRVLDHFGVALHTLAPTSATAARRPICSRPPSWSAAELSLGDERIAVDPKVLTPQRDA